VTYDRDAALDYARRYWLRVASDGYIAGSFGAKPYLKVPDETVFVHDADTPTAPEHALLPDGTVIPWSALDDCTHFISCCVGAPPGDTAGGLHLPADFPSGPYGILGASRCVETLIKRGYVEVLTVDDKASPGLDRIAPGDLIGYYRHSQNQYSHLTMYAGGDGIICHTYCRADTEDCTWDHLYSLGRDDDDFAWRLLRFTTG
jgi:hypothetical protein